MHDTFNIMNGREHMEAALALAAAAASDGEVPVGAVIVRESDGSVIGKGRNRREKDGNALAHAELEAINDACKTLGGWRLEGCTMYVTLEPCPMCAGAVISARLDRLVFGAYDSRSGACGSVTDLFSAGFDCRTVKEGGFMETECSGIIRRFFSELRRRRGKFRLTRIAAEDQLRRASEASGIPAAELLCHDVYFLRRKAVPIGLVILNGGAGRVMIFDEYKNSGFSLPEPSELFDEML